MLSAICLFERGPQSILFLFLPSQTHSGHPSPLKGAGGLSSAEDEGAGGTGGRHRRPERRARPEQAARHGQLQGDGAAEEAAQGRVGAAHHAWHDGGWSRYPAGREILCDLCASILLRISHSCTQSFVLWKFFFFSFLAILERQSGTHCPSVTALAELRRNTEQLLVARAKDSFLLAVAEQQLGQLDQTFSEQILEPGFFSLG